MIHRPQLSYSRIWSAPDGAVSDRTFIASVLAEPTFDDLLSVVGAYGLLGVREILESMISGGHLAEWAQQESVRMLRNIEAGFARAA